MGGGNATGECVSARAFRFTELAADEEGPEAGLAPFLVVCLVIGIGVSILLKKWDWFTLPFTLVVFAAGIVIGGVEDLFDLGRFSGSLDLWRALNPESLLYVFLPPLLFVSAFEVEYHIFRRLAGQAILLATVGVVLNVFGIAAVSQAFGYNWGLAESLLFGSVFGATDPVAVVALLQDVGAPETLSVLIEGESLLNDGVGFVLFSVFFEKLSGRATLNPGQIIGNVLFSSLLGIVIGIVTGSFGLVALQQVWEDSLLATVISVVSVFATFSISEAAGASGVISAVCLGLYFASYSDGYIKVDVKRSLVRFWKKVEYILNTVLFILAGITVVNVLSGEQNGGRYKTTKRDFINLGFLFIAVNIVRAGSVAALFWPLKHMGYGLSRRRASVLSYAGLRGAIALIAALLVVDECTCESDESAGEDCVVLATQIRVIFHTSGIVLLTLLVNGTTTKYLVNFLGLQKGTSAARNFFEKATIHVHDHMDYVVESLKRHPYYKSTDWKVVWRHVPILSRPVFEERKKMGIGHDRESLYILRKIDKMNRARFASPGKCYDDNCSFEHDEDHHHVRFHPLGELEKHLSRPIVQRDDSKKSNSHMTATSSGVPDEREQLQEARFRFLNLIKASYRTQFEEGAQRSWPSMQILIEAAARCQDHPDRPINEWDSIESYVNAAKYAGRLLSCDMRTRTKQLEDSYNVVTAFIRAHKSVVGSFKNFVHETTQEVVDAVLVENSKQLAYATAFTERIEREYPEVAAAVKTNIATQRILREMGHYAEKMLHRAEIDERDLEVIEASLEKSRRKLADHKVFKQRTEEQIIKDCSLFLDVESEVVSLLVSSAGHARFDPGDVLFSTEETQEEVYLITYGKCKLSFGHVDIERTSGDFLGIPEFVIGHPLANQAIALTNLEVVAITFEVLRDVSLQSPQLYDNLHRETGLTILEVHYPQFSHASFNLLKSVLPHVKILHGKDHGNFSNSKKVKRKPSVVGPRKPIFFHGGVVIGIKGTVTLTDGHQPMPMAEVVRVRSAMELSGDATIMHVSAEAVRNIEEYLDLDASFNAVGGHRRRRHHSAHFHHRHAMVVKDSMATSTTGEDDEDDDISFVSDVSY